MFLESVGFLATVKHNILYNWPLCHCKRVAEYVEVIRISGPNLIEHACVIQSWATFAGVSTPGPAAPNAPLLKLGGHFANVATVQVILSKEIPLNLHQA